MSSVPPTRAICRSDDDLLRAFPLFIDTTMDGAACFSRRATSAYLRSFN
jgi:hypothetical protein